MCSGFVFPRMEGQCDAYCGRIFLGDMSGGGAVMLRALRFLCVEFWISTRLPMNLTIHTHKPELRTIRLAPDLPQSNYCVSR